MSESRPRNVGYVVRGDLDRQKRGEVLCPLGVYPCDPEAPLREGFEARFSTSDDDFGDQYEFRLLLSADRIRPVVTQLMRRFVPDEAYALYEEFSFDAYRESDAYSSDDVVAKDRILRAWETYSEFFIEDGRSGFGVLSYEPAVEVFLEEHGALYIAVGLPHRAEMEEFIAGLGLQEIEGIRFIENFRHQHRDILMVDGRNGVMTEEDIKFSVIESLGMKPNNWHEGEAPELPAIFWIHLELDLSFTSISAAGGCASFGVSAENYTEALAIAEERLMSTLPGVLVARILECHRVTIDDLGDEIQPEDRESVRSIGVWYESGPKFWTGSSHRDVR